jgi:tRNA G26 N,N-dimethylase Trm1
MAVLCARNPHVCFYKYGAIPLPKKYCHEVSLFALSIELDGFEDGASHDQLNG